MFESPRGRKGFLICTAPSPSMARGVWNDPQRYLDSYWSRFPAMRCRGDWASVDQDGPWFLHGRADESMNVAGRKVGPADVEEAMMLHPGVPEVAVIGVPDDLQGEAIVDYAVPQAGMAVDGGAVCATVAQTLGPMFRPREVLVVSELPQTQSGKIVRRLIRRGASANRWENLSTLAHPGA